MSTSFVLRLGILGMLGIAAAYGVSRAKTVNAAGGPLLIDAGPLGAPEAQTADDPTVLRSRYAAIDFDVLPGQADRRMLREPAVSLQLFPDVTIFGVFDRYDPNPDGVTWVGHVDGVAASFITLVYSGGIRWPAVSSRRTRCFRSDPRRARRCTSCPRSISLRSCARQSRLRCGSPMRTARQRRTRRWGTLPMRSTSWCSTRRWRPPTPAGRRECEPDQPRHQRDEHVVREQRRRAARPARSRDPGALHGSQQLFNQPDQPAKRRRCALGRAGAA